MVDLITKATKFATDAHGDQVRKYHGTPYIEHPLAVAEIVKTVPHTEEMLAAAILHDVVEDTPITIKTIRAFFGDTVGDLVESLTDVSKPEDGNRAKRKEIESRNINSLRFLFFWKFLLKFNQKNTVCQ